MPISDPEDIQAIRSAAEAISRATRIPTESVAQLAQAFRSFSAAAQHLNGDAFRSVQENLKSAEEYRTEEKKEVTELQLIAKPRRLRIRESSDKSVVEAAYEAGHEAGHTTGFSEGHARGMEDYSSQHLQDSSFYPKTHRLQQRDVTQREGVTNVGYKHSFEVVRRTYDRTIRLEVTIHTYNNQAGHHVRHLDIRVSDDLTQDRLQGDGMAQLEDIMCQIAQDTAMYTHTPVLVLDLAKFLCVRNEQILHIPLLRALQGSEPNAIANRLLDLLGYDAP